LRCSADVAVFGGASGGGKSFALLLEPLYHVDNAQYRAVLFRRVQPQLKQAGGLWDVSEQIYPMLGATPNQTALTWRFPSGALVSFAAMEHPQDRFNFQGLQASLIAFDEATQFEASQFWYLCSRLRSAAGVRASVRLTCNPDPRSWLAEFVSWWIDQQSGYPIPERAGKLRWFIRVWDRLVWGDSVAELKRAHGEHVRPKSATFIPSFIEDNPALLAANPDYLGWLESLPLVERERLRRGNWRILPTAGLVFKRAWFKLIDGNTLPESCQFNRLRYWDRAATPKTEHNDPDWTVGLRMSRDARGNVYVEDMVRFRDTPGKVQEAIERAARLDGREVTVCLEQDPAQAGKAEVEYLSRGLTGYTVKWNPVCGKGKKEIRAMPASSLAEHGFVYVVKAHWNDDFLDELEAFPDGAHDDCVDPFAGGCSVLGTQSSCRWAAVEVPEHKRRSILPARTEAWQFEGL